VTRLNQRPTGREEGGERRYPPKPRGTIGSSINTKLGGKTDNGKEAGGITEKRAKNITDCVREYAH